jgi:AcrR family transcriptional regulator
VPRDGSATRARLLRATTEVVAEVGYPQATTRLIAQAAGVSEGSIYWHFPDKPRLFLAALLERTSGALDELSDLPERAGTATVRDVLVEALLRLSALRDEVLPLELALLADPELAKVLDELGDDVPRPDSAVAGYLRAEQALGRVRADVDADAAAAVLLTLLFGLSLRAPGGVDRAALESAVDVVLRGVTG